MARAPFSLYRHVAGRFRSAVQEHRPAPVGKDAPLRFCSSFWTESVLGMDGKFRFCCRNNTVLGNWIEEGLESVWHSATAREFRRKAARGEFPNDDCRRCHRVGAAYPLGRPLASPLFRHVAVLEQRLGEPLPNLAAMRLLFDKVEFDDEACAILEEYGGALARIARGCEASDEETRRSVTKLRLLEQVVRSFLTGDETPPVVAPSREVNLIAVCNARCIHCPGLHAGQLDKGVEVAPGVRAKYIDPRHLDQAMALDQHIFEFWGNGTEFLLYPKWKEICRRLAASGVVLSVSTNGIALTSDAVHTLIDSQVLGHLNVSIDGATRETIEAVRVNVKYDRLVTQVRYLIDYARRKGYSFALNFTFTFMRRNYREIPRFVEFVHGLFDGGPALPGTILFTPLLEGDAPSYLEFLAHQHHSLLDREELQRLVLEASQLCDRYGLQAYVTYTQSIKDFIAAGYPFPGLPAGVTPSLVPGGLGTV
jgi:MoaA/NifB/PqqE/SkfB family radical SAM enzyme